jgi:NodT family efflux transporter outer membrane factor (OMF) lipoprotein
MTRKEFEKPQYLSNEELFRANQLAQDSTSIATVSWNDFFTDKALQTQIDAALQNNLDLQEAIQNMAIAQAYLKQSKAAYFPTGSVGTNYTMSSPSMNSNIGQNSTDRLFINQFDITANIGWEIDVWGKLKSQEKAQMSQFLSSVAVHQNVKSNLVASIASAYYQLLALDEQKRIISETIAIRQKNLETTQALKLAGTLTEVAVKQSEALVYNAKSSLLNLNAQIKILENTISLLKGESGKTIERTTLIVQQQTNSLQHGVPTHWLANRPDVRKAELDLRYAFEMTQIAKAQFYPSLKLTASGGLQSINIDQLFSAQSLFATLIAGISQPIFNKRQIKTNWEISKSNQEKAYINYRKTLITAGKEVSDALAIFEIQDDFISLKQKELQAYDLSVKYSQELVNYGMANYLEVLNADVNRLNAELNIANAQYTKLNATVELYRALGGGWK